MLRFFRCLYATTLMKTFKHCCVQYRRTYKRLREAAYTAGQPGSHWGRRMFSNELPVAATMMMTAAAALLLQQIKSNRETKHENICCNFIKCQLTTYSIKF